MATAAVATEALLVPGAAAVAVVAAAAAATSAAGGGRDQLHWTELVWETVGQRSPSSSHLRASRTASATSSSSSSHQRHFYHHQQDYVSEEINCGVAPVCTIFGFKVSVGTLILPIDFLHF